MNIGVLGATGRLGSQLVSMGATPIKADVLNKELRLPKELDVVINCAAYTHVDDAESDEGYKRAVAVNYRAVQTIYDACQHIDAHLIHISTDYVFGGNYGPYSEDTRIPKENDQPINAYGLTKLAGEAVLLDSYGATIVRTTGLYGGVSGKHDFLKHVVTVLQAGIQFSVTDTLIGNQTYIPHLAEAVLRLCGRPSKPNLIHIASSNVMSRYEFAHLIASIFDLDDRLIRSTSSAMVPGWVAKRPERAGLATDYARSLGLPIYSVIKGVIEAHENWDRNSSV